MQQHVYVRCIIVAVVAKEDFEIHRLGPLRMQLLQDMFARLALADVACTAQFSMHMLP
jgi:hypothetical protein